MSVYNGYTYELSPEQREKNRRAAKLQIDRERKAHERRERQRGTCPICGDEVEVYHDGTLAFHVWTSEAATGISMRGCVGSGLTVAQAVERRLV